MPCHHPIQRILISLVLANTLTGSASPSIANRCRDAGDIFSDAAASGAGAKLRVSAPTCSPPYPKTNIVTENQCLCVLCSYCVPPALDIEARFSQLFGDSVIHANNPRKHI